MVVRIVWGVLVYIDIYVEEDVLLLVVEKEMLVLVLVGL